MEMSRRGDIARVAETSEEEEEEEEEEEGEDDDDDDDDNNNNNTTTFPAYCKFNLVTKYLLISMNQFRIGLLTVTRESEVMRFHENGTGTIITTAE